MAVLNYTHTLTAGTPENVNHVQQNFTDARTVINALDDANFASTSGVYTGYRTIQEFTALFPDSLGANTFLFRMTGDAVINGVAESVPKQAIHLAAADYAITGRTTKLRVRAVVASNATAPGTNFTFGLAPVTVAGGADMLTYTAGAAVAGGNLTITTPPASTATLGTGSDFTIPADGLYVLFVSVGAVASGHASGLHVALQQRWT